MKERFWARLDKLKKIFLVQDKKCTIQNVRDAGSKLSDYNVSGKNRSLVKKLISTVCYKFFSQKK